MPRLKSSRHSNSNAPSSSGSFQVLTMCWSPLSCSGGFSRCISAPTREKYTLYKISSNWINGDTGTIGTYTHIPLIMPKNTITATIINQYRQNLLFFVFLITLASPIAIELTGLDLSSRIFVIGPHELEPRLYQFGLVAGIGLGGALDACDSMSESSISLS